jgi:uncharacterized protein (TIGR04255 family)
MINNKKPTSVVDNSPARNIYFASSDFLDVPSCASVSQKYPKPPILEAILQVRYEQPLTEGKLKRVPKILRAEYPKSKEEADYQLAVELKDGASSPQPKPQIVDRGPRLTSENDQKIVVMRGASTLLAYQAPYPGWDEFVASAKRVFEPLREKLGYRAMKSVGLRYTNRLDIPLKSGGDLIQPSDYLTFGVSLPENGISTRMGHFQVLADIELNHDHVTARVQAATAIGALIGHASLIFDIDIIAAQDVPAKDADFWALIDRMRDDKNAIFESSITDKARMLFGWSP